MIGHDPNQTPKLNNQLNLILHQCKLSFISNHNFSIKYKRFIMHGFYKIYIKI